MRDPQRPLSTNAAEVEALAGAWIARRDHGDWNTRDQAELDAWLALSPAHTIAFIRLDDVWQRANRLQALAHLPNAGAASARRPLLSPRRFRMAAAFLVVSAIGVAAALYASQPKETTYATAVGGHEVLKLADGSKVELNTDTVVRISRTAHRQIVKLDRGEAFFEVKHDPQRLFVVLAGKHRVTDLGTKFLVRSEPNHLEVALVEGSARLDSSDGQMQTPILLTPGDTLTVANNLISTTRKTSHHLAEELGWRRGMLMFHDVPLGDVVAEFNRYGGRKLVVADRATARIPVSASFPTNGADSFLELAETMLGVKIEQRGNETVISR